MSYQRPTSFCLQLEQSALISYLITMGKIVLLLQPVMISFVENWWNANFQRKDSYL